MTHLLSITSSRFLASTLITRASVSPPIASFLFGINNDIHNQWTKRTYLHNDMSIDTNGIPPIHTRPYHPKEHANFQDTGKPTHKPDSHDMDNYDSTREHADPVYENPQDTADACSGCTDMKRSMILFYFPPLFICNPLSPYHMSCLHSHSFTTRSYHKATVQTQQQQQQQQPDTSSSTKHHPPQRHNQLPHTGHTTPPRHKQMLGVDSFRMQEAVNPVPTMGSSYPGSYTANQDDLHTETIGEDGEVIEVQDGAVRNPAVAARWEGIYTPGINQDN